MVECVLDVEERMGIPAELIVAIAYVESRFNPYAVNVQTDLRFDKYLRKLGVSYTRSRGNRARYMYSIYPHTFAQAKKLSVMFRYAENYDVGLMQVSRTNFSFLKKAGIIRSKYDLFDPCTNIRAGALLLKMCIERFGIAPRAIDCYHRGPGRSRERSAYVLKVGNVLFKLLD